MGEGLQGFAEAHVVGEDAVQAVAGEKLHPVETCELIVAQRGVHAGGWIDGFDAGEILEFRGELGEVRRRFDAEALEAGEGGGVERVEFGSIRKLRIDERGEVMEDAAHAADRQFQRVAIRQWRVDVAGVRAVEGFLEEIAF